MVKVDLYKIDSATGVTLTKMEQQFNSNVEFATSWAEMKAQDWSHIFITQDADRFSDHDMMIMKKRLLTWRGGEA